MWIDDRGEWMADSDARPPLCRLNQTMDESTPGTVVLLGIPYDLASSYRRGPALAPARIRQVLHSGASNLCTERGRDLAIDEGWRDGGDLALPVDVHQALTVIEESAGSWLDKGARLVALGGDHIVTYPLLRAYARAYPDLTVLHLDAHPDLYDTLDGDRLSHACPFARVMEEGSVAELIQAGIRTMNPHQREQAERFGVQVIEAWNWHQVYGLELHGPLYLSIDLDVLDPAYAPGVSHHEPGGISSRDVLEMIKGLSAEIVGADIVEYNPERDTHGMTAALAAKLIKELVGRMLDWAPGVGE